MFLRAFSLPSVILSPSPFNKESRVHYFDRSSMLNKNRKTRAGEKGVLKKREKKKKERMEEEKNVKTKDRKLYTNTQKKGTH